VEEGKNEEGKSKFVMETVADINVDRWKDIDVRVLRKMVDFANGRPIAFESLPVDAIDLLEAASVYGIASLVDWCVQVLATQFLVDPCPPGALVRLYEIALRFRALPVLRTICEAAIPRAGKEVLVTKELMAAGLDALAAILSMNLSGVTELDVFLTVVRWVSPRRAVLPRGSIEVLLATIRWESMDRSALVGIVKRSGLFTSAQYQRLLETALLASSVQHRYRECHP
jgi:hypothetical protein